jgi:hypothetical protein
MAYIIRQKKWTDKELHSAGFRYYHRRKSLVMARRLPESEAPLTIRANRETLTVQAGYIICYDPGRKAHTRLEDYDHWPCAPEIFHATYKAWDTPWKPRLAEKRLLDSGCKPYYKFVGVWAKQLEEDTYIQSLESPQPILIPTGDWVAIQGQEHPYHMSDEGFRERYTLGADG